MANRFGRYADAVARVPGAVIPKAAEAIDRAAVDEARRATGDGRMSGMGRRGAKLRTKAKIRNTTRGASAVIRGLPAGGWAILSTGAKAHDIKPKRGTVLAGPAMRHPVRGPVHHPRTAGKGTWGRVIDEANRILPKTIEEALGEALR